MSRLEPVLAVAALAFRESARNRVLHALVAATVILLRVACYVTLGGTLVAWPLEEWLLARRARRASPDATPDVIPDVTPDVDTPAPSSPAPRPAP